MATAITRYVLTIPAIRAQSVFRQTYGRNQILKPLKCQRSKTKIVPYILYHRLIRFAIRIMILCNIGICTAAIPDIYHVNFYAHLLQGAVVNHIVFAVRVERQR